MIKTFLAALVLASAVACGGQIDSADDAQDIKAPLSFEPFTTYAAAKAHAAKYGNNPRAIALAGDLSSDKKGYQWHWTFQCDGSVYAIVSAGPTGVRVTSHGLRTWLMGVAAFDPAQVNVTATDLLSLLKKQGYANPDSMSLSAPLTQKIEPRWTASVGPKTLFVDALTGDIKG
ncbi:MAG: hypothetical protein ACXWLM_07625 [Myxococcales bacterium]